MVSAAIEGRTSPARWLGPVAVAAVVVLGASAFLPSQCPWVDEATQRVGLAMGPAEVCRWLAGGEPRETGQFPDRMPPGSYWAGQAWGVVFGPGERPMRWLGVACVATAGALVFGAASRAYGTAAGWASGLIFATSPGLIVAAVEIRAYPIFLLASAVAFFLLILSADGGGLTPRKLAWLTLTLAATMATHFFGFALAGAAMVTLVATSRPRPGRLAGLIASALALAAVGLAILPFIRAAMAMTGSQPSPIPLLDRFEAIYKLLPALVNHPALMVRWPVELAVLVGMVVLGVSASRSRSAATRAVALTLGAGLAAVALVEIGFARAGFNVCSPGYNIWTRPGLCLIASAGLAAPGRVTRRLAGTAAVVVIAAQSVGLAELVAHGDHFAHGPHRAIAAILREFGPDDLAVIHDDDRGGDFPFIANPIRADFGPDLEQFVSTHSAELALVRSIRGDPSPRPIASLRHRYLVVIRPAIVGDKELARQVRQGDRSIGPGPVVRSGVGLGGRRLIRRSQRVAFISARIDVFERLAP